ncbi:hypothetical protein C8R45DRAFT_1039083 [Mycena sanguinolenta]|nr:hypothetical protein C8R45DRAFT_1039083 [Mycena sanguinolenta]
MWDLRLSVMLHSSGFMRAPPRLFPTMTFPLLSALIAQLWKLSSPTSSMVQIPPRSKCPDATHRPCMTSALTCTVTRSRSTSATTGPTLRSPIPPSTEISISPIPPSSWMPSSNRSISPTAHPTFT